MVAGTPNGLVQPFSIAKLKLFIGAYVGLGVGVGVVVYPQRATESSTFLLLACSIQLLSAAQHDTALL